MQRTALRTAAVSTLVAVVSTLVAAPAFAEETPADMAAREALLAEAHGFGENTTGGLDAEETYVVTTEEDGNFFGTLRFAAESDDPMWITFAPDVNTIVLDEGLYLGSNTTIDGRGADVTLTSEDVQASCFLDLNGDGDGRDEGEVDTRKSCGSGGIEIWDESNIIITNIALDFFGAPDFQDCCDNKHNALRVVNTNSDPADFPGDDRREHRRINKDAPVFTDTEHTELNRTQNIWLHKNSFSRAGDKLVSIMGGANGVTVSNNRFFNQGQSMQLGNYTTQTWDVNLRVTTDNNFFDNVRYRTPVSTAGKFHVYNNYVEGFKYWAISSQRGARVFAQNNLITANEDTVRKDYAIVSQDGSRPGDTYGYILQEGNKFDGGARPNNKPDREKPHLVDFDETTFYTVAVNEAFTEAEDGGSFRDNIIANAGAKTAADPPAEDPPAEDDSLLLTVTTLDSAGPGSLAEALESVGNTTVRFDDSLTGAIALEGPLQVNSNTTLIGSDSVQIRGAGLVVRNAENVVLDNLDLRVGNGVGIRIAGNKTRNVEVRNTMVAGFEQGLIHILNGATDVRILGSTLSKSGSAAITAGFVHDVEGSPMTIEVSGSTLRRTRGDVSYLNGSDVRVLVDGELV